jgi:putative isomerase
LQMERRNLLKMGAYGAAAKLLPERWRGASGLYSVPEGAEDPATVAAELLDIMEAHGVHEHPALGKYYSGYGPDLFTWESYLDAILLLLVGDTSLSKCALKIYLHNQQPSGFIPRHWAASAPVGDEKVWRVYESEEHAQPFLFQIALFLARADGGDVSWIDDEMYERLKKYLKVWGALWKRGDRDLCVWASAPHSGQDNQFDRVGVWRSYFCAGADLNSFLYLDYLAAEKIAKAKGRTDDASAFAAAALRTREAVLKYLWDEKDGFFYDRDVRTGKHIKVKSGAGFFPLWAGIPTQEQAKRMVNEHLMNPKEFSCAHPVPSYAINERNYTQHHVPPPMIDAYFALDDGHANWRGGTWGHSNYFITHGLQRYGFDREARLLAQKSYEVSAPDKKVREWFNAETGAGDGAVGVYAGAEILMRFSWAEIDAKFEPGLVEDVSQPISGERVRAALGLKRTFRLRT